MSFETMQRLQRFIKRRPALADTPHIVVEGKPVSPREALEYLERGNMVEQVLTKMETLQLSVAPIMEEELWLLTEEHYRRLLQLQGPQMYTFIMGMQEKKYKFALEECLEEVEKRTRFGKKLAEKHQKLILQMMEWMQ